MKKVTSLFLLLLISELFYGQFNNIDQVKAPSPPDTKSLINQVEIPVDYFTGRPNINIPIHTITDGGHTYPISLSYGGGGIQVNELSTWVGLGWSLNAGGAISRIINNNVDEGYTGITGFYKNNFDYYSICFDNPNNGLLDQAGFGKLDTESDFYSFNFNGYSGKFLFDDDGNIIQVEQSDIKIEVVYNQEDKMFSYWVITTPDGTKYFFGDDGDDGNYDDDIVERTYSYSATIGPDWRPSNGQITKWQLVKIQPIDERSEIFFEYKFEDYQFSNLGSEKRYFNGTPNQGSNISYSPLGNLTKTEVISPRLFKIFFKNLTVEFSASESRKDLDHCSYMFMLQPPANSEPPKRLNEIVIKENDGNCILKYVFNMDYFESDESGYNAEEWGDCLEIPDDRFRLRLLGFQKYDCRLEENEPPYSFKYFEETFNSAFKKLPRRNSHARDYWGFFNGANQNDLFIPEKLPPFYGCSGQNEYLQYTFPVGVDRNPKYPEMQTGQLSTIVYPTGESEEFEFEPHEAENSFPELTLVNIAGKTNCGYPGADNCCNTGSNILIMNSVFISDVIDPFAKITTEAGDQFAYCQYAYKYQVTFYWKESNSSIWNSDNYLVSANAGSYTKEFHNILQPNKTYDFLIELSNIQNTPTVYIDFGVFGYDYVNENKIVGGIRLKSDKRGNKIKTYEYNDINSPDNSSGKLIHADLSLIKYFFGTPGNCETPVDDDFWNTSISSSSLWNYQFFKGSHIVYKNVKEIFNDNNEGAIQYVFYTDQNDVFCYCTDVYSDFNDYQHLSNSSLNGKLKKKIIYNSEEQIISQLENNYIIENEQPNKILKVWPEPSCPSSHGVWHWSDFVSARVLLSNTTETLDFVQVSTDYEYNPDRIHLNPIKITTLNSGISKSTDYKYPYEVIGNDPMAQNMINKNMKGIVLEKTIDNGAGGGVKNQYTQLSNDKIVLKKVFTASYGSNLEWILKSDIQTYDNTSYYPKDVWDKSMPLAGNYTFTKGLLTNMKYPSAGGRNWTFNYKYNYLLEMSTDNAGITNRFYYDNLLRLKESVNNNNKEITTHLYEFKLNGFPENKIKNKLSYPGSSTITDLNIETVFDGFGRQTLTNKIGFTQDGNDYPMASVYDQMDRVEMECDPGKGGCTKYEYEPSPLNRVNKIIPPGTDKFISIFYGTNSEAIGSYPPYTLYLKRQTDENGKISEIYTDIFNRKIKETQDAGGLNLSTIYEYNDRDQVTKIIPPNGVAYEYTYYPDGLLWTKKIPDKGIYFFTYNAQDQVETETLPNGNVLTYEYHSVYNDLVMKVKLNGAVIKEYEYDMIKGWKTKETLSLIGESGSIVNQITEFDDLGRVLRESRQYLEGTASYVYSYDDAGNMLTQRVTMTGPSGPVNYSKKYVYDKGVRLTATSAKYPVVGITSINDIHFNDNEWMDNKLIGNQENIYGYTQRGWLNLINGLNATYPQDFVFCEDDKTDIHCEGPFTVTDISVLFDCIQLGSGQSTNVAIQIAGLANSGNGSVSSDTTTLIFPFNGGNHILASNYPNQFNASIPGGSSPQSSIEEIIQTIIDCLEANQSGDGGPSSSGIAVNNNYIINSMAEMLENAINAMNAGSGANDGNNSTAPPFTSQSLFGMILKYEEGDGELSAPPQYNGNISKIAWRVAGELKHEYGFAYDGVNRLLQAKHRAKNEKNCSYMPAGAYDVIVKDYDNMGNILGVSRNGFKGVENDIAQYGLIDELLYEYEAASSKLRSVSEGADVDHGFRKSTNYDYDATGNMISNGANLQKITYDQYMDLPIRIEAEQGHIEMTYDANGRKLRQRFYKEGNLEKENQYQDGVEYKNGRLEAIYHEEGRIVYDGKIPNAAEQPTMTYKEYFLKDHLGNIRVRYVDKNGDGLIQVDTTDQKVNELTGSYHYYPFGMEWEAGYYRKHPTNLPPTQGNFFYNQDVLNKYRYNGKEFIEDFDIRLYEYGARMYDPAIGRFICVDPIGDKFPELSTFNYASNNPIAKIDLCGLQGISVITGMIKEVAGSVGAFVAGVTNSVGSNAIGGAPGTRGDPNDFGDHAQAASVGQTTGDVISVVAGAFETAIAVVGVTAEGLGAPETAGATALAIPETITLGVHGTILTSTGLKNLLNPTKVEANRMNPKKEQRKQGQEMREKQPGSEKRGKDYAKDLEKREGKDARRQAHDIKEKGSKNRTVKELKKDYKIKP